jgi:Rv2525c-like, glycoside hydrolase-like domain
MTLTGTVTRAPAGAQGFDTDTVVDAHQARQLRAAGFEFCLRYLSRAEGESSGDLTPGEATLILDAGLALMAVQHVQRRAWVPTAELGITYGKTAASNAAAVGFPRGVNIWLDLEGVLGSVLSEDVIRYCNAWFLEVESAGFVVYVGSEAILTGDERYRSFRRAPVAAGIGHASPPSGRVVATIYWHHAVMAQGQLAIRRAGAPAAPVIMGGAFDATRG